MNTRIGKTNIGCNALIVKNDKILLGIRKNGFGEGTYGLPGGHLEYREKLQEAVIREVKEEVGIDVTTWEFVSILDQIRESDHYLQINFLITDYQGEIANTEPNHCEGWEWFDIDKLPENMFWPHVSVIQSYTQKKAYF